jgi:hypothetical protein
MLGSPLTASLVGETAFLLGHIEGAPCLGRRVIGAELGAGDLDSLLTGVVAHLSQDRHVFAAHDCERIIHRPERSAAIEDVPAEVEEGSTAEHASVRIVSG